MKKSLLMAIVGGTLAAGNLYAETSLTDAIKGGTTKADLRLRYESVDQSNNLKDATALTLRTRLTYTTAEWSGFSATVEAEDVRIVGGVDNYTVGPTGFNPGEYSVIADPESTELDQGFLQYKSGGLTAKFGRQVMTMDNHRFLGHVGWRQDRQVYDGLNVLYKPTDKLTINYAYIGERNSIFADEKDADSKDNLLNVAYQTDVGKLTLYSYQLEVENTGDNALDTNGIRFTGSQTLDSVKLLYTLEYAEQESESGANDFDADYTFAEFGAVVNGLTVKVAQEVLGSDKGMYAFSTPLATLHKFNGWADIFLATPLTGLVDDHASVAGKLGGGSWSIVYHDYSADKKSPTVDDLGDEWGAVYSKKFGKNYSAGVKYSSYDAGDIAANKVDTKKLWVWLGLSF